MSDNIKPENNSADGNAAMTKNKEPTLTGLYISNLETENTGGYVMVDYIHLKSGKLIGVSDECICVFPCEEAKDYSYKVNEPYGEINLLIKTKGSVVTEKTDYEDMKGTGISYYIDSISTVIGKAGEVDLIQLKEGRVMCLDGESVCLYDSKDIQNLEPIEAVGKLDLTVEVEFIPDSDSDDVGYTIKI